MTIYYILASIALLITIFLYFKSKSIGGANFNNISVTELEQLSTDKNTTLIDVRTQNEIQQGKMDKALEIELGPAMHKKMSVLDKNKKYIVYCRSGRRSVLASNMMAKMGFTNVNNLLGGYNAWKKK